MAAERLVESLEQPAPRLCPFEVGKEYTKESIYRIFEVAEKRRNGNWNTGYTKYDGYWFIFSNIGTPGRTGHDYGDRLEKGRMTWFGKTKSHIGQASIVDMVSGTSVVFIFYRRESRSPFTFAGVGKALAVKDSQPVEVEWELIAAPYTPLPLLLVPPPTNGRQAAPPEAGAPATPVPVPAVEVPEWVQQIFTQRSYYRATLHAGRHRPTDAMLGQLLGALDAAPGRQLPLPRLAKAIGCAELRIGGILSQASRIFNLDGYQVLELTSDRGFVRLDRDLAIRQFLAGHGS